ncbi:MAG: phosphodiester glycosidase family protein [Clostridia bacterium]|jgi:exopolysaccharide biosynthesis protein
MQNNKRAALIIIAILSFILIYAGQFFVGEMLSESAKNTTVNPVTYRHMSMRTSGLKHEINILEIDVSKGCAIVKSVLSYNRTYGFEFLSDMIKRGKAYAGVNAGFFYEYGQPSGLVIIDGKMASSSSGKYPSFILKDGKAVFETVSLNIKVGYSGGSFKCRVNQDSSKQGAVLYNSFYGATNRIKSKNVTVTVENNVVVKISKTGHATKIPKNGYLISFFNTAKLPQNAKSIKKGTKLKIDAFDRIGADEQAYECGCYLVKNGKNVAPSQDAWIGSLESYDPRTAIGIKKDGKVMLVTCDGRQPKYSYGMTGKEFAKYLISLGIKDAAMLDGGASTEMILNGKIVNRTSGGGDERLMGGAIAVIIKK